MMTCAIIPCECEFKGKGGGEPGDEATCTCMYMYMYIRQRKKITEHKTVGFSTDIYMCSSNSKISSMMLKVLIFNYKI